MLTQSTDSGFELDYIKAITSGNAVKRFNRDGKFHISKWTGPGDSVSWRLLVSQKGAYKVRIHYAAKPEWASAKYVISVGAQTLVNAVQSTGDWYQYKSFDLGTVNIPKAGPYTLNVRPAAQSAHNLMYFQSITLEPVL